MRGVRFERAVRQDDLPAVRKTFGDEDDRSRVRHLALEELDDQLLAHAVFGVDGVALLLALDLGQGLDGRALARVHHRRAYLLVQTPDGAEQPARVVRRRVKGHLLKI